jgi:hypothetical protein
MELNDIRFLTGLALAGFMLFAAGCQSNSKNALNAGGNAEPPEGKILQSELRAYCPPITLREGTTVYTAYAKGADGDPTKLVHQASITDVTRNCKRSGGMMTINVGVAGRVVPGPAGKAGTVTMPIRVAVVRGEEVLYSQLFKHQATVGSQATQFMVTDTNITIPVPSERNVQIFAGYDEGPSRAAQTQ